MTRTYEQMEARESALLHRLFEDETTTRRQREAAAAELREVQAALAADSRGGETPAAAPSRRNGPVGVRVRRALRVAGLPQSATAGVQP